MLVKYNKLGLKDLQRKLLIPPEIGVINEVTAHFYFWRLIKTCEKFIDKMGDNNNNVWKLDEKLLKITKRYFVELMPDTNSLQDMRRLRQFILKLVQEPLKTNNDKEPDINDFNSNPYKRRFDVFRLIKFERHIKTRVEWSESIRTLIIKKVLNLDNKMEQLFGQCWKRFEYPNII